jgi:hypothetical protein
MLVEELENGKAYGSDNYGQMHGKNRVPTQKSMFK